LLDFEPFLSSSAVIDRGWAKPGPSGADKPGPFPSKRDAPGAPPPSLESTLDVQSFQLASLALAVCHVVVVVQDRILDPTLLRYAKGVSQIHYRCEDGCFPVSASCMLISNPDLFSSSETGVNLQLRI
jgi:hypothetical protein